MAASTCSARRRPTTCITPAGHGRAARLIRGPSSSPRISAARAIRWRCAGPQRSSPTPRLARSSFTSTTSSRPSTTSSASRRRAWSTASRKIRSTASASRTPSMMRRPRSRSGRSILKSWAAAAIYHDGWMASAFGPRIPWVPGLAAASANGRRTRTNGNSTTSRRTGRRPTTSPAICRRSSPK